MNPEVERSQPSRVAAEVWRYRAGEAGAVEALARRACTLALRTAAAIMGSREEASDIAQDVAVEALRSLGNLRDPAAFDGWVHRITVRQTLRALRRRRGVRDAETPLVLLGEDAHPAAPEGADRDATLAARQLLAAALAELPPRQRVALALRYVHDLSDAEIAAALGCRPGSVHALLSRGRAALRRDPQLAELALAMTGGA